jgi:hypothetical protein
MTTQLPQIDGPAGAAFQLRKPAKKSISIEHEEGTVSIRAGASSVTVQLRNAVHESDLRDFAWRIVQEALDIRAATHREALSTYRGDHECAYWFLNQNGYTLVIVDVVHTQWSMNATLSVGTDAINPSLTPPSVPYHPALRFYRLSQISDDLFDAFRNAYLALECIVSDVSPINANEKETAWLKRVLNGPLSNTIPGGFNIDVTVDEIYKHGRLPLFHAKNNFYKPQGDGREAIQSTLKTLQQLLASIMKTQISPLIAGGWGQMSQALVDGMCEVSCKVNEIMYRFEQLQEKMDVSMELVDSPRRFGNLWTRVTTPAPTGIPALESIVFLESGQEAISMTLPEKIPLQRVSSIRVELNQLYSNVQAPNPLHQA